MADLNRANDLAHVPDSVAAAVTASSGLAAASDPGPFFHGTSVPLAPGARLAPGYPSNYRSDVLMNHIYFTALKDGAGLAAEIAVLLTGNPTAHVYLIEPTGEYENDPNVTDKKFPGNPTRSYRSAHPLVIINEVHDWVRLTDEQRTMWRERLAAMTPDNAPIIN
ncbi:MAG: NAD(+)--rifampin ADP-ribosyltransferase [Actinomycetales bacterium]|nr:NAD(+)--rifampin ADP-ribosyltransferase [Actinomycetales bacterium]